MTKREAPQTRQKRTRRASIGTPRASSLRAANVRKKLDPSERPAAPVELLIENVRCFAGSHVIPIRPLTVLVGENSFGKSTLLAALSIVSDNRFPLNPEFNQPPYSLGSFQTIATCKSGKHPRATKFSIGFKSGSDAFPNDVDAVPRHVVATYVLNHRTTRLSELRAARTDGTVTLRLLPSEEKYEIEVVAAPTSDRQNERFDVPAILGVERDLDLSHMYLSQFSGVSATEFLRAINLSAALNGLSLTSSVSIAPIRTKPKRTYDEAAEDYSPEGGHVPFVLARILSGADDSKAKKALLTGLRRFGEESGLFKGIEIRNLGDRPGDPFQVVVTVAGGYTGISRNSRLARESHRGSANVPRVLSSRDDEPVVAGRVISMCLIIDNSVRDRVFFKPDDRDFQDLHSCLIGDGLPAVRIVYGGELRREYLKSKEVMKQLVELDRKSRARIVSDAQVDEATAVLKASGLCRSNDAHVIALAKVGKVALLCACDKELKRDFKTKALIDKPRGKVYNRKSHKELLREFCGGLGTRGARRRKR